MNQVYGIEVHEILARICKINLLLHHDGHTNIEANRSVLDTVFTNPRLNPLQSQFSVIVGNPPFGTEVSEGDDEQLGQNTLESFQVAAQLRKIDSEQVIVERSISLLEPGGRLGLILPDGLLNNQGDRSNCPRTRTFIAAQGHITAIISLPDHAFRKSGAQNKTSILFFRKFTAAEKRRFDREYNRLIDAGEDPNIGVSLALRAAGITYRTYLGEAAQVGYTPAGTVTPANDLYRRGDNGALAANQTGTILGEWKRFLADPDTYDGYTRPDCTALLFDELWDAHASHRLDPKYHLFKVEAGRRVPVGWVRDRLGNVLQRREDPSRLCYGPRPVVHGHDDRANRQYSGARGRQGSESPGMESFVFCGEPWNLVCGTCWRCSFFVDRPLEGVHSAGPGRFRRCAGD